MRDALTLALGVLSGVLSAAFGVGGAVVSTPGIRALGASAFAAVGTTLPAILPGALSGTLRYSREGLIDWWVVRWAAPTGAVSAVGGSLLSHAVPGKGHALMLLTAALLAFSAWRMARGIDRADHGDETDARAEPAPPDAPAPGAAAGSLSPWAPVLAGLAAGLLSGLLGIGGGVILLPVLGEVMGMPPKKAVATSLACVGVMAVPGTVTHAWLGDIDWRFAILLAVGVVPGARLGAAAAIAASERRQRVAVAVFLGVIAAVYGISELAALR